MIKIVTCCLLTLCGLSFPAVSSARFNSGESDRPEPGPIAKDRNLPKLYSGAAKYYTGRALRREFGNSFTHGYAHRADCDQRISRTRIKCEPVRWVIGDVSYRGWSRIWYKRRPANNEVYWHYAFRIVETNGYCVATGGSNCSEVHRVR